MDAHDDEALVTLGRATSKEFCLARKDLADLESQAVPNPHFRSGAPMILYRFADLQELAHKKHGGAAGLARATEKRELRAARAAATRGVKKTSRKAALSTALHAWGLSMRSDSWLCENWIKHGDTPEWPLAAVVRRMCQMRFLHEHTNYARELRDIRSMYRESGHRWEAGETEQDAEERVLGSRGWPARWPWLSGGWTPANHHTFPKAKKLGARMLLLCLSRKLGVDNATCTSIGVTIVAAFMTEHE